MFPPPHLGGAEGDVKGVFVGEAGAGFTGFAFTSLTLALTGVTGDATAFVSCFPAFKGMEPVPLSIDKTPAPPPKP